MVCVTEMVTTDVTLVVCTPVPEEPVDEPGVELPDELV